MQNFLISLGGSLIVPDEIDVNYLKRFRNLILSETKKGKNFFLIPGGGETCRYYQKTARAVAPADTDSLDWIGIAANRLHSYLLRAIFGRHAYPEVVGIDKVPRVIKEPVAVGMGGLRPGNSSDSTSVTYAAKLKLKTIVNLTDVAGIYDKDPSKFKNAKLIPRMTWRQFRAQFGSSRKPGQHKPFDPSAAWLAERLGLKVIILHGRDLKNFQNWLSGKKFNGTMIE